MKKKSTTKRVTLKDIAKRLGISDRSVSEALRDDTTKLRVSAETRKRVQAEAQRLGYRRNWAARALRTQRSGTFAILSFSALSHFMMLATYYARERFLHHGIAPLVFDCRKDSAAVKIALNFLRDSQIDGVLLLKPTSVVDLPMVKFLHDEGIAVAAFGGGWLTGIPRYTADTTDGLYQLFNAMVNKGFRTIDLAFTTPVANANPNLDRHRVSMIAGFEKGATEARAAVGGNYRVRLMNGKFKRFDPDESTEPHAIYQLGYQMMLEILDNPERPELVMFPADEPALGALRACGERKVSVPSDIAITGFQNSPESSAGYPPISSVSQPLNQLCSAAVDKIITMARERNLADDTLVELPCKLHLRASTGHQ